MARKQLSNLDFNNVAKATNLVDPTSAQDAATKAYVDSAVEGLNWKDSVLVSTQGNLNLASPGATIDGITPASGVSRVLVRLQSSAPENGIYIWNGAASAMTRAADASTFAELEQATVTVEEGTNAGVSYRQTAINGTLGSDDVTFSVFGTAAGAASESSAGIAEIATQAEVDAGTDDARFLTPLKLATSTLRLRKFSASFGDGSATQFTITHNFNTRDVQVAVYGVGSPYEEINCDVEHDTVNSVIVRVAAAPTSNQFRAVVIG